jgi:CheY-like chemotaxis protein
MGTVLLIEDGSDDVFLVALGFEKARTGHSLVVVSDGYQGIDYLKGRGHYTDRNKFPMPKLILLDLGLPGMSGFEFLKWLRSEPELKHLPVAVLTGSMSPADASKAYQLGANSFLVKAADSARFTAALKEATDFWLEQDSTSAGFS